jgi:hypothetical protein
MLGMPSGAGRGVQYRAKNISLITRSASHNWMRPEWNGRGRRPVRIPVMRCGKWSVLTAKLPDDAGSS